MIQENGLVKNFQNTSIEDLRSKLLHYKEVQEKIKYANNIKLDIRLIEFFLEKVDIEKLISRIIKHYNLIGDEVDIFFKDRFKVNYQDITSILSRATFIDEFRKSNTLNDLLSNDEKKELTNLYLAKKMRIVEKSILVKEKSERKAISLTLAKELKDIKHKKVMLKQYSDLLVSSDPTFNNSILKKNPKRLKARIKQIENFLSLESEYLTIEQIKDLKFSIELLRRTLLSKQDEKNKGKNKSKNTVDKFLIENEKTKAYHRQIELFKKQQEAELLKRIENRKNGLVLETSKAINKLEPIVIEAYIEDFNSARSRFVLSVLTANNIKLAFYNGLIKLLNDDETFDEIYFYTVGSILKFSSEKYPDEVYIDISSNEIISNILSKQKIDKDYSYVIIDCLSILYYINSFYTESEKVEVSIQDIENIKINPIKDKSTSNKKSIVYLTNNKKTVKTIKIKKGIRKIEGAFLIRGHWRRQNYANGVVKLIRIEPFWKGKGDKKSRTYKIMKQ